MEPSRKSHAIEFDEVQRQGAMLLLKFYKKVFCFATIRDFVRYLDLLKKFIHSFIHSFIH